MSGDGAASGDKKPRARRFRGQGQGQGQVRRFGGPGRFRRGGQRRSENGMSGYFLTHANKINVSMQ